MSAGRRITVAQPTAESVPGEIAYSPEDWAALRALYPQHADYLIRAEAEARGWAWADRAAKRATREAHAASGRASAADRVDERGRRRDALRAKLADDGRDPLARGLAKRYAADLGVSERTIARDLRAIAADRTRKRTA
jgi:hypothetical protein